MDKPPQRTQLAEKSNRSKWLMKSIHSKLVLRKPTKIGQPKEMDKSPQMTQIVKKIVWPEKMGKSCVSNGPTCSNSPSGPNGQNMHLKWLNLLEKSIRFKCTICAPQITQLAQIVDPVQMDKPPEMTQLSQIIHPVRRNKTCTSNNSSFSNSPVQMDKWTNRAPQIAKV